MTRDAEWLLREKYRGEQTAGFFADCTRLTQGEPLAYVIGHVPFLNTTIYLDSHPLIPRVETEFWVEQVIHKITHTNAETTPLRILDMCAGSGCVGIACAKAFPMARVDFVEIDASHHPTIEKNILANDIDAERTHIMGGNLFEQVSQTYDLILANPPYIDQNLDRTEPSVLLHEPHGALFADDEGFALIARIIEGAPHHLTQTGILVLEHEPEQTERIAELGTSLGFSAETKLDQYHVTRYTLLTRRDIETVSP